MTPYLPNKYSLKSTDFIGLLNSKQCKGILASLDIESLFTNVPIDEIIQIILENAYNHDNIPPPKMPKEFLKQWFPNWGKLPPGGNITILGG